MIERDPVSGFPIFEPDGDVLNAFMLDRKSRVKIIQGPQGSGTSSACCMHIFQQALEQKPQHDGKQRFRAHVLRETYSKLEETTIPTWRDWFPPGTKPNEFGTFFETRPYKHEVRVGSLELDVTFVALEDIRDAKSFFMSLETSLIWFNEVQFAQYEVFSEAVGRVSPPRFPAVKDGGCEWGGLIADTNAPPADHWLPIMRGDVPPPDWMTEEKRNALKRPANWGFYMQPAGLIEEFEEQVSGDGTRSRRLVGYRANPEAENLKYLPKGFYEEKIAGKTKSWIDSNIMNRSSVVNDGRPVYPQFRRDVNVSTKPLEIIPGVPVTVGLDFGRQPAASIGQVLRNDWFIQREYIGRDMSAAEFAPLLKSYLAQQYPGFSFIFWGDPAGQHRGEATDRTPFQVFAEHGMRVLPAPNPQNMRSIRWEAVNGVLLRRSQAGRPSALLIDPGCVTLITGLAGGYFMRRLRVTGERYSDEPEKNQYSHVCFVAGTSISTPDGPRPIETLVVGDFVNTPIGPRRVRFTLARMADVAEYEFSSGTRLTCTRDHPFYTQRGFVAIDAVEYTDQIATDSIAWKFLFRLRRLAQRQNGQSSRLRGCGTTIVQMVTSAISAAATYIGAFGRPSMAQFLPVTPSTIGTPTHQTTIQTTSNACQRATMSDCTWSTLSAELPRPETSSGRSSPPRNGVNRTQSVPPRLLQKALLALSRIWRWSGNPRFNAATAEETSRGTSIIDEARGIAQKSASAPRGACVAMMTRIAHVTLAALSSVSAAIGHEKAVRLLAKRSCDRALVHNVEIEDAHSYYAGGLLVSNCEAFENQLLGGGEGRAVTMGRAEGQQPVRVRERKTMRRVTA